MADLYSDENIPHASVLELRKLGHDVLTALDAGQANQKIPDAQVLTHAHSLGRAVLTLNRRHFIQLHKHTKAHSGIVVCTSDTDFPALALRTHKALLAEGTLANKLVRVIKRVVP
jgi:hypothetical protein